MADSQFTGVPMRSSSHRSLRPRPAMHSYQYALPQAARSMQNLSSVPLGAGQEHNWDSQAPRQTLPLKTQRLPNQAAPLLATQSTHDLSSTASDSAYTGTWIPSASTSTVLSRQVERLRSFLLWNLAFAYAVPAQYLGSHLSDEFLRSEPDSAVFQYFVRLGQSLQQAHERVQKNQLSLIITVDRLRITSEVVNPAIALGITPEYLCEQLMWFPEHQFALAKRHKTALYSSSSKKSFFGSARKWSNKRAQTDLAQCLVSDDCVVSALAPTEELQVLLGSVIAEFGEKHCKSGMGSVTRKIYSQAQTSALLVEVAVSKRMPQQQGAGVEAGQSEMTFRHRPISTIHSEDEADDEGENRGDTPLVEKSR